MYGLVGVMSAALMILVTFYMTLFSLNVKLLLEPDMNEVTLMESVDGYYVIPNYILTKEMVMSLDIDNENILLGCSGFDNGREKISMINKMLLQHKAKTVEIVDGQISNRSCYIKIKE
ncbi:hypothetical protein [Vibrio barjaei]|uniref:hypothetical protein n=1 Tax=Vibrio barjaei TaxID=1676683 RepID=UPI002283C336|nr:hypothetical protein [Vibrio barjaei]MCY9874826.1 hypothetical protein [Vibrio barjaei]